MSLTENESRIGFIGIGIMGKGMATNLVAKGHHRLLVWNRSVEVAQTFAAKTNETYGTGTVIVADSVEGLMKECDVVYSMLSTLEASEAVFPHIIDGLRQRPASSRIPILIDCATLTVERFQAMHKQLEYEGRTLAHFVEAPVSGSKLPAEQGQLIFLVSGHKESATQTCAADFNAMGKRTFFFGEKVGQGTQMKLVVNMIMGAQLAALAEGVALCEGIGCDPNALLEVLGLGAMASPLVNAKTPAMINRNYTVQFPLKHAQKDMRFALALADESAVSLPVSSAANQLMIKARAPPLNHGDDDFCSVVQAARSK